MNSAPIKPLISTSDLGKIDVRIGTISRCRGYGVFGDARNAACRRPATNSAGTASWKRSDIEFTNNDGPPMSNDEWEKEFCTPD